MTPGDRRAAAEDVAFRLDHLMRPWFSTTGPDGRFLPKRPPQERVDGAREWAADRLAEQGWPSEAITELLDAVTARRDERLSVQVHAAEAYGAVYDEHHPDIGTAVHEEARRASVEVKERLAPVIAEAEARVAAATEAGIAAAAQRRPAKAAS